MNGRWRKVARDDTRGAPGIRIETRITPDAIIIITAITTTGPGRENEKAIDTETHVMTTRRGIDTSGPGTPVTMAMPANMIISAVIDATASMSGSRPRKTPPHNQ